MIHVKLLTIILYYENPPAAHEQNGNFTGSVHIEISSRTLLLFICVIVAIEYIFYDKINLRILR